MRLVTLGIEVYDTEPKTFDINNISTLITNTINNNKLLLTIQSNITTTNSGFRVPTKPIVKTNIITTENHLIPISTLTFDNNIELITSLSSSSVYYKSTDGLQIIANISISNAIVTVTPSINLTAGNTYNIYISDDVFRDKMYAFNIVDAYTWSDYLVPTKPIVESESRTTENHLIPISTLTVDKWIALISEEVSVYYKSNDNSSEISTTISISNTIAL